MGSIIQLIVPAKSGTSVQGWENDLIRNDKLKLIPCAENYDLIFRNDTEWNRCVGWDILANRLCFRGEPPFKLRNKQWTPNALTAIQIWLSNKYGLVRSQKTDIEQGLCLVAMDDPAMHVHPVRQWLESLQHDGIRRIDSWLIDHCGAREDVASIVGRWWLIGAVARAHVEINRSVKMDNALILEGHEGLRKSEIFRNLCHKPEWYLESPIKIGDDSALEKIQGKWIAELAELTPLKKADDAVVKQFFTNRDDEFRTKYDRNSSAKIRTAVFCGTTNKAQYLTSGTNRRFWSIHCHKADLEAVERVRDQLWAEAYVAYKNHEAWVANGQDKHQSNHKWWPHFADEKATLALNQKSRQLEDDFTDFLCEALLGGYKNYDEYTADPPRKYVVTKFEGSNATPSMLRKILDQKRSEEKSTIYIPSPSRIKEQMEELGFRQGKVYVGKNQVRVWEVNVEITNSWAIANGFGQ